MKSRHNLIPILKDSYVAMLKNSIGSKMFRNYYVLINGKRRDIINKGELACAYFVSSILKIFDLVDKTHFTVDKTVQDLQRSGWKKIDIKRIAAGSVIVWKSKKFGQEYHKHIGFYIGDNKAISTDYRKGTIALHHLTFNNKRKIEAVLSNNKLKL